MSLARRKHLIELANRFDVMVLEDSPYREIRFEGYVAADAEESRHRGTRHLPRNVLEDPRARSCGSVGRSPRPMSSTNSRLLKLAADTQCSTLNMAAVSLYLDTYDIESHIQTIRQTYRHKKNVMLDTIAEHFPEEITFTDPQGGMFTWLTVPEGFDTEELHARSCAAQAKVAYVPGATFFPLGNRPNYARMSYSDANRGANRRRHRSARRSY